MFKRRKTTKVNLQKQDFAQILKQVRQDDERLVDVQQQFEHLTKKYATSNKVKENN